MTLQKRKLERIVKLFLLVSLVLVAILSCNAAPIKSMLAAVARAQDDVVLTPADYIQDGLIGLWDAEWNAGIGEHDSTSLIWRDIATGEHDISLSSASFTWEDNFLDYKSGRAPMTNPLDINTVLDGEAGITIELVYKHIADSLSVRSKTLFGGRWQQFIAMVTKEENISWCCGDGTSNTVPALYDEFNVAVTYKCGRYYKYMNGIYKGTHNRSVPSSRPLSPIGFGCPSDYGWSPGPAQQQVYCIRIYARALTASEMAYNYSIDKARFNLP